MEEPLSRYFLIGGRGSDVDQFKADHCVVVVCRFLTLNGRRKNTVVHTYVLYVLQLLLLLLDSCVWEECTCALTGPHGGGGGGILVEQRRQLY